MKNVECFNWDDFAAEWSKSVTCVYCYAKFDLELGDLWSHGGEFLYFRCPCCDKEKALPFLYQGSETEEERMVYKAWDAIYTHKRLARQIPTPPPPPCFLCCNTGKVSRFLIFTRECPCVRARRVRRTR